MRDDRALLAIETGGSRGRAALALGGRILERSLAAGLNPNDVGFDLFEKRLGELLRPLLEQAKQGTAPLRVVAGIAGAGEARTMKRCRNVLERLLRPYASRPHIEVMTDVGALARACIGDGTGIVIIAGTGSICLGLGRRRGRCIRRRAGGTGRFSDPGSGAVLGHHILVAALATLDGMARQDLLVELICQRYGIKPQEIPSRFLPLDRREAAGLARVALDAYDLGDGLARRAVRTAAADLAGLAIEVSEDLNLRDGARIFASGGLFESPVIRRLFSRRIARHLPGARKTFIRDPLARLMAAEFNTPGC